MQYFGSLTIEYLMGIVFGSTTGYRCNKFTCFFLETRESKGALAIASRHTKVSRNVCLVVKLKRRLNELCKWSKFYGQATKGMR